MHLQISKQKDATIEEESWLFRSRPNSRTYIGSDKPWFTVGQAVYHNVNEGPVYINLHYPPLQFLTGWGGFEAKIFPLWLSMIP